MLNFTGQTKKRVVNLGNKKNDNSNYLEKTRLQRKQRELARREENACIVVQSYVRRYLDLDRASEKFMKEWVLHEFRWESVDQWRRWILEFIFICERNKYDVSRKGIDHIELFVRGLKSNLSNSPLFPVEKQLFVQLVGVLTNTIKFQVFVKDRTNSVAFDALLECLNFLHCNYDTFSAPYPQVVKILSLALEKHGYSWTSRKNAIDLIFALNTKDSHDHFVEFLSSPSLFPQIQEYGSHSFLGTVRLTLSQRSFSVSTESLPESRKAYLLANLLQIHGIAEFRTIDYSILGTLISTITFSIIDKDLIDYSEENEGNRNEDYSSKVIVVDSEVYKSYQVLYSSTFISQAIQYFTDENSDLSKLVISTFAALTYLIPPLKSKLCMLITITPGSYRWFFEEIKKDELYKCFIDNKLSKKDYIDANGMEQIYSKVPENNIMRFWKLLFTFEVLYSYWLIVSNDLETFSYDKLDLNSVKQLLEFLKRVCLTLVFNHTSKDSFYEYEKLKDMSVSLLNQLYSKNTRLRFLPDNYWDTNTLNFNIDNILHFVIEEEERIIEAENNSLESDTNDEVQNKSDLKRTKVLKASSDAFCKLEILKKMPFFVPFKDRVKVFQTLIELDRSRVSGADSFSFFQHQQRLEANIRREHLLKDAFNSFHKYGPDFKNQLSVTLFNNEGGQEAGIDGGGITKEFLTSVAIEGFAPGGKYSLFKETDDHQLYPNDEIFKKLHKMIDVNEQREKLQYLQFLGNIIGKCFHENVLIDISFAPFFLTKWCSYKGLAGSMKNSINDLSYLDKELYTNLMKLTSMDAKQLEELDINFVIDEKIDNVDYTFDLSPPRGETMKVDVANRLNYVHQISNFKLNQSLYIQTKYFLTGLFQIISSRWLSMFDSRELQMLISGEESDVNIQDWKQNVEYGGYFDDDVTIIYFWEVVTEMSPQQRCKLIKFVTSVSRAPLLGFGSLNPKFGIRNAGYRPEWLPTASTCVNLLKLPDYKDKELIRSKLLYSINTEARFDLS